MQQEFMVNKFIQIKTYDDHTILIFHIIRSELARTRAQWMAQN